MIVRPEQIDPDGTIIIVHQGPGVLHRGVSKLASLAHPIIAGAPNLSMIELPCPDASCGWSSLWPIGGGADPEAGQRLHLEYAVQVQGEKFAQALKRVNDAAEAEMPGRARFAGLKSIAEVRKRVGKDPLKFDLAAEAAS